ncbi:unnamed protein product [Brassica oleracea var. botrytis]|uniref:(rape) hypothetical protein n=1 Tax=Brassica napus TaxID=3708 RepID=A0A816LE00_BRANA|nr:unnamed protein product [Brassica napus]
MWPITSKDRIASPCHEVHIVSSSGSLPPRLFSTRLASARLSSLHLESPLTSMDAEMVMPRKLRRRRHENCSGGDPEAGSRDDDVSCQGWRRPGA